MCRVPIIMGWRNQERRLVEQVLIHYVRIRYVLFSKVISGVQSHCQKVIIRSNFHLLTSHGPFVRFPRTDTNSPFLVRSFLQCLSYLERPLVNYFWVSYWYWGINTGMIVSIIGLETFEFIITESIAESITDITITVRSLLQEVFFIDCW